LVLVRGSVAVLVDPVAERVRRSRGSGGAGVRDYPIATLVAPLASRAPPPQDVVAAAESSSSGPSQSSSTPSELASVVPQSHQVDGAHSPTPRQLSPLEELVAKRRWSVARASTWLLRALGGAILEAAAFDHDALA